MKRDSQLVRKRDQRGEDMTDKTEQREVARTRRTVLGLIESGQLGRAMNRVTSHGLGDLNKPEVKNQLIKKFPPRTRPLPSSVAKIKPIDSFKDLRGSLLSLDPGTAPGAGGLRNEYLTALGERMEDEDMNQFEQFGLTYTAGELPEWVYQVWQTLQTVAPFKNKEREAVRPLGLKN